MSETVLRVGKRGEIYTRSDIREKVGIKPGGLVKARVEDHRLVIEPIPTVEEMLEQTIVELSPSEAEKLSEEAQKEASIYG